MSYERATFEKLNSVRRPHADSPLTLSATSQYIEVVPEASYDIRTDGNGDACILFGTDDTVTALATGVGCDLIRETQDYNPVKVPKDHTHMAAIGYGGSTPKLFITKLSDR